MIQSSFLFEVLRMKWLILSFVGGSVLVLATVLTYVMMWRPRPPMTEDGKPTEASKTLIGYIPWVVILTWLITIFYYFGSPISQALWPER
jgi:hypothetical protein